MVVVLASIVLVLAVAILLRKQLRARLSLRKRHGAKTTVVAPPVVTHDVTIELPASHSTGATTSRSYAGALT